MPALPSPLPHPSAGHSVSPGASHHRRKQARPQELLDAALALFVEKGFAATRSEQVARRAGVSKGTLYLYYPSKEELLKAVIRQNLSALIAEGLEIVDAFEGSTAELLSTLMLIWWQRFGNTPASGIHKIMVAEAQNFPEIAQFYNDEVIVPADVLLARLVQRGVASGEFRPLPLKEITIVLFAPLIFMCLHKHSLGACAGVGAEVDAERVIRTHIDVVLHGLLVRTPPGIGDTSGLAAAKPAPRATPQAPKKAPNKARKLS